MLQDWIWLTTRKALGPRGVLRVLEYFGTPERAFYAEPEQYDQIPELPAAARASLREKGMDEADRILGECDRLGLRVMTLQDGDYPGRLREISAPPAVLYIRGRVFRFDEEAAIGVVGSREPSPYGERVAAQLGLELARGGALLISGIAQGIDSTALKGALISEYPPGTRHKAEHFPVRNRLISGLSLGVVAVECARFSGTMKTIEHAMDQDRDIFAVPGNIDAPRSEGPNWLLRQGARPVTCAQDILEEYWLRFPQKLARSAPLPPEAAQQRLEQLRSRKGPEETGPEEEREEAPASASPREDGASDLERVPQGEQRSRFTDDQLTLLRAMAGRRKPSTADELVEETQIPARRVLSALTMLQVDGAVREHPGKRFSPLVELEG